MAMPQQDLLDRVVRAIRRSPGWEIVDRTPRRIRTCHADIMASVPAIGRDPRRPQTWLTLDFEIQQGDRGLGMFWLARPVTDPKLRLAIMDALAEDSERTGFVRNTLRGLYSEGEHAYSGQRISDAWWDLTTGIDFAAAESSLETWLEYWASRAPAMLAAIDRVTGVSAVGTDWSDDEARAAIAAYFEMLDQTRRGEDFVKRRRLEALMAQTRGRSRQSCEFKLRNISAVMSEMGLAYLKGYVPADNFQQRLADLVADHLEGNTGARGAVEALVESVPAPVVPVVPRRSEIEEPPPEPKAARTPATKRAPIVRLVVDVGARDVANRALGKAGERFVVDLERTELTRAGRPDLAERVRWVADVDGDGLGYDVLSFSPEGDELFIEVKTTNGSKAAPFFVTANEVAVSARHVGKFRLYRLFEFASGPKLYVQAGSLGEAFQLDAVVWRATARITGG